MERTDPIEKTQTQRLWLKACQSHHVSNISRAAKPLTAATWYATL
jgi:hypothetical protein